MSTSEIKRITDKAEQRCREGRESPSLRKDDAFVVDLIYLLDRSTKIIDALANRKSVIYDDVLTVKSLQSIIGQINDPDLERFFHRKIAEGLGADVATPPTIGADSIKAG